MKINTFSISALTMSMQISSADRAALKACAGPMNAILEPLFTTEITNKLKCVARKLQIPFEYNIPHVNMLFPVDPASSTPPATLDCSTFQFESMLPKDIISAITGDMTSLASTLDGDSFHQAFETFKSCVKTPSITSTAAANTLISQYDQQKYNFKMLMNAVRPDSQSGEC